MIIKIPIDKVQIKEEPSEQDFKYCEDKLEQIQEIPPTEENSNDNFKYCEVKDKQILDIPPIEEESYDDDFKCSEGRLEQIQDNQPIKEEISYDDFKYIEINHEQIQDIPPIEDKSCDDLKYCETEHVSESEDLDLKQVPNINEIANEKNFFEGGCDEHSHDLDFSDIKSSEKHVFICETCGVGYELKSDLMLHINCQHGSNRDRKKEKIKTKSMSNPCTLTFLKQKQIQGRSPDQELFVTDLETQREERECTGLREYSCDLCKKIFQTLFQLSQHKKRSHATLICLCKRKCNSHEGLRKHLLKNHVDWFMCKICGQVCPSSKQIKKHYLDVHEQVVHTCSKCRFLYPSPTYLKTHSKICNSENVSAKCDTCGKMVSKGSIEIHLKTHMGIVYPCGECSATFLHYKTMVRHRSVKHYAKAFKCDLCKQSYSDLYDLNRHIKIHKSKVSMCENSEQFTCALCEKKYYRKDHIIEHIQCIHMNEGKCEICGVVLATLGSLKRHMNAVHSAPSKLGADSKIKPKSNYSYACSICEKNFTYKRTLSEHIGRHYGQVYACDVCKKTFLCRSGLHRHKKVHSKHWISCVHCGRKFEKKWDLREHLDIQHYGRLFNCDVCGRSYASRNGLCLHKKKQELGQMCTQRRK